MKTWKKTFGHTDGHDSASVRPCRLWQSGCLPLWEIPLLKQRQPWNPPNPQQVPFPQMQPQAPRFCPRPLPVGVGLRSAGGRTGLYELPLFEDPEHFTYWTILQGMDESNSAFLFWQRLAQETGIDVEFVDAPEETATEKYNLMVSSGDLADVICEKSLSHGSSTVCPYNGGYGQAIADGVYMNLTDIIPEQCPNYWSFLLEDPSLYRDLTLDDGTLYCFAGIMDEPYGPNQGAWVRTDMMKQAGVTEIPTTEDGWLALWRAMKSANVVEQPTRASNLGDLYPNIAEAYGTTATSNFLIDLSDGAFLRCNQRQLSGLSGIFPQLGYSDGLIDSRLLQRQMKPAGGH